MYKSQLLSPVFIACITLLNYSPTTNGQSADNKYNVYVEANQLFETLKEPDHDLINGRLLMPPRIHTYGHPYLEEDKYYTGDITINNKQFKDIQLKYDVLDQCVITEFSYKGMSKRPIILNNEFIQNFSINGRHFIHEELPGLGKKYFQEFKGNSLVCYYYFYKREEEKPEGRYLARQIHPTKVDRYIRLREECVPYISNRSFFKKFDKKYRSDIKKYLRSRKLNVKTISDKDMVSVLMYCESLLTN